MPVFTSRCKIRFATATFCRNTVDNQLTLVVVPAGVTGGATGCTLNARQVRLWSQTRIFHWHSAKVRKGNNLSLSLLYF